MNKFRRSLCFCGDVEGVDKEEAVEEPDVVSGEDRFSEAVSFGGPSSSGRERVVKYTLLRLKGDGEGVTVGLVMRETGGEGRVDRTSTNGVADEAGGVGDPGEDED